MNVPPSRPITDFGLFSPSITIHHYCATRCVVKSIFKNNTTTLDIPMLCMKIFNQLELGSKGYWLKKSFAILLFVLEIRAFVVHLPTQNLKMIIYYILLCMGSDERPIKLSKARHKNFNNFSKCILQWFRGTKRRKEKAY